MAFSAQISPKMYFGVEISKSLDLESTPPRYHMCPFSVKTESFEIFGLNMGKLPNYVRYFGSKTVEGVAES